MSESISHRTRSESSDGLMDLKRSTTGSRPWRSTRGRMPDPATGATVVPIYATSTFTQEAPGQHKGYEYSRSGNPTRSALETCLAALEGGERAWRSPRAWRRPRPCSRPCGPATRWPPPPTSTAGPFACSSGSSSPGAWSRVIPKTPAPRASPQSSPPPPSSSGSRRRPTRSSRSSTSPPSPSWPTAAARCWPWTTRSPRPISSGRSEQGADLVVHSTTKYLGGHSDVIGGAVVGRRDLLEAIAFYQNAAGGVPGPFDCLAGPPRDQDAGGPHGSALRERPGAGRLAREPSEGRAGLLPGLQDHPGHDIAARQMRDFGGMISVRLRGGGESASRLPFPDAPVQPGREPGRRGIADRPPRDHDPRQHPRRDPDGTRRR